MLVWQALVIALLLVLVVGIYGIGALLLGGLTPLDQPPRVRVIAPADETLIMLGQTIRVQAEASGSPIQQFELWDQGRVVNRTSDVRSVGGDTWAATQEWRPSTAGIHRVVLQAIDVSQRVGASAPISVSVTPRGQITFASNRVGPYQLFTMLTNGEGITSLTVNELNHRAPHWSANGLLAFITQDGQGNADIWLARDGATEKVTTFAVPRADPVLSPQGERLAFVEASQGVSRLYVESLKATPRLLVGDFDDIAQPSWSPDGRRLAFMGSRSRNADIYTIKLDGSDLRRLTSDPAQDWQPAWSPSGSQIAFVSNRSGSHQIYVMRADGSNPTRLTSFEGGAEQPAWSPDGLWLAFVAYTGLGPRLDAREIYIMRGDGADPMRITRNAFDDTDPSWAP